jgi:3-dehydroquinate dehydratase II
MQGPNLNRLGVRRPEKYGTETLADIEHMIDDRAKSLNMSVLQFQSNHEGALIDWLQAHQDEADAIVFNPAGLSFTSAGLADAIADTRLPTAIVHLSCFEKYEHGRRSDIYRFVGDAYISGLGSFGYITALEAIRRGLKHVDFW